MNDSPVQTVIEDQTTGRGAAAKGPGRLVTRQHSGWLTDGSEFDSSHRRSRPFRFPLNVGMVIPGPDAGLVGTRVGRCRRTTAAHLVYGAHGAGRQNPHRARPWGSKLSCWTPASNPGAQP